MPYSGPIGHGFAVFMALYNRRLVKLAKKKITAGTYGAKNVGESYLVTAGFAPGGASMKLLFKGIRVWLKLELKLAFTPAAKDVTEPSMASPLPQSGHYKHA
jgi:hypothetical protein